MLLNRGDPNLVPKLICWIDRNNMRGSIRNNQMMIHVLHDVCTFKVWFLLSNFYTKMSMFYIVCELVLFYTNGQDIDELDEMIEWLKL